MSDLTATDVEKLPVTFESYRAGFDLLADYKGQWQGMPVPIEGIPLRLQPHHPFAEAYRIIDAEETEIEIIVGGPPLAESDDDERIVNMWVDRVRSRTVYVFQNRKGRAFSVKVPMGDPGQAMKRLTMLMQTIGASDAWDEKAERQARYKLCEMLTSRQWRHYELTGSFFETSPRSGLTYIFRRLRPTIALTSRWKEGRERDEMRCLAVLCMHPVGFYNQTWAGCMVPSDDVIAHLLFMRADEADFWAKANQHEPWMPEAGL